MLNKLRNFAIESANIMFDDSKNDIRSLPKTVRLQILIVLSFVWSTVFSLYVFSLTSFIYGWLSMILAHIGLIFATYITFKIFHKARKEQKSVFVEGNYNPAKIFSVLFIIFFIFIFTKGIDVLTRTNSYETPYSGPDTTTEERIKKFVK
ncbi:UbiA family prenyltransferase [Pelagibacteraceae bacterium]|jgi:4-hydroxybenzoate polyprenyltransferase|nr:UbiA family prenyltransferase [Pelagibacteraceae bacterium]